jgi:hypothetical protein
MKPVTSPLEGSMVPCLAGLGRGGDAGDRLDQFGHAEILQREPKNTGVRSPWR